MMLPTASSLPFLHDSNPQGLLCFVLSLSRSGGVQDQVEFLQETKGLPRFHEDTDTGEKPHRECPLSKELFLLDRYSEIKVDME